MSSRTLNVEIRKRDDEIARLKEHNIDLYNSAKWAVKKVQEVRGIVTEWGNLIIPKGFKKQLEDALGPQEQEQEAPEKPSKEDLLCPDGCMNCHYEYELPCPDDEFNRKMAPFDDAYPFKKPVL